MGKLVIGNIGMARNILALIAAGVMRIASAQDLFVSPAQDVLDRLSSKMENISSEEVIGDRVNFQTGDLSFRHVDIKLVGRGPDIIISRKFSVSSRSAWNWRHDLEFADWALEVPSVSTNTTMGINDWKVVGADPLARCTKFGPAANVGSYAANYWWQGVHLDIPGQSKQELMSRAPQNTLTPSLVVPGASSTYSVVTNNGWTFACLPALKDGAPGEGFVGISPDGNRYWFDKLVYKFEAYESEEQISYLLRSPRWKASLLVTRVEDRFGNYVKYEYSGDLLDGVTSSDGRVLKIYWSANRGNSLGDFYHIERIVSQPGAPEARTWLYSYLNKGTATGTNVAPRWDLQKVTLPDLSYWSFNIGAFSNSCYDNRSAPGCKWSYPSRISGSITAPSGVTGTFKLTSRVPFRKGRYAVSPPAVPWANSNLQLLEMDPITVSSPALEEKSLVGPGVDFNWKYRYGGSVLQAGALANAWIKILNPDGTLDAIYLDSAWGSPTEGQIIRQEKYPGPVTILSNGAFEETVPAMRIETFEYVARLESRVGIVPRGNSNALGAEYHWPLKKKVISMGGVNFVTTVNSFDFMGRPISITKSNSVD